MQGQIQLTYKQTTAFKSAISGRYNFILFGGAIRGGKSYWLLSTFIHLASIYPKSRWIIVRESLPTLKRTTLVTWNKFLEAGLKKEVIQIDNTTHTYTFRNGSQNIFMAESFADDKDLTRFAGLECNGFGADEINELQEETLDKMFERAGTWFLPVQPKPLVIATCNPASNWVKDRVYEPYVKNKLPETWSYIPAKVTDNPHIPADFLISLKQNLTPIKYRRFVEGDWYAHEVKNAFAMHYDTEKHESREATFNPALPIYIAIDFNLNPLAITFWHIWMDGDGEHAHCFDEMSIEAASIEKIIQAVRLRYGSHLHVANLTGDAMGNRQSLEQSDNAGLFEQLRRAWGMRRSQVNIPANLTHQISRADVNYVLLHFPDFKINPIACPILTRDMQNVQCDAMGQIMKRDRKDLDQRADALDTARAIVNTYLKSWIERHQKVTFARAGQTDFDVNNLHVSI